jgi:hypothetical protein
VISSRGRQACNLCKAKCKLACMVKIAISQAALDAIAATMPEGSYGAEIDPKG